MSKLFESIKKAGVFYIATVDKDQPHVRPFGAIEEISGKIYIVTGNTKAVFRQFIANPKVEFAGLYPDGSWIRVSAQVKRTDSQSLKEQFLELSPNLKKIYKADDGIFEVFELEEPVGYIYNGSNAVKIEE